MTNYEKSERKTFKSYSKNLSGFIIKHGVKPIKSGTHYWGIRISEDNGSTWKDFVTVEEALKIYPQFTEEVLTKLRDESLDKDETVFLNEAESFQFRKRIRFYKEFLYNDELIDCLKLWKETNPNN